MNCVVMMPCALSKPAGSSTVLTELVGLARNCSGVQPISFTLRSPCAVNFGVEKYSSVSAPGILQAHDLGVDGRLGYFIGDLGHYFTLSPSTAFSPVRKSFP